MKTATWIVVAIALMCGSMVGSLRGEEPASMGRRYVDLYNGFSLCPPLGADRSNIRTASQLVSWRGRDAKTGAVQWTLLVGKANDTRDSAGLDLLAGALADTLRQKESFKIESSGVIEAAGHKAIDIKAHTEGATQWWQRQVWLQVKEGNFLILRIIGPVNESKQLDSILSSVLGTVQFIDRAQAQAKRQEHLDAGAKRVKELDAAKVLGAVVKERQWYLIRAGGKACGYRMCVEGVDKVDGKEGVRSRNHTYVAAGETAMDVDAFATPDRASETCTQTVQSGSAQPVVQTTTLEGGTIRYSIAANNKTRTMSKAVPEAIYMPTALTNLLPRLVDLKTPATYSFVTYTPQANAFDVLTIAVIGPEAVTVGDAKVTTTRVEVQAAEDVAEDIMWLDEKGLPVLIQGSGGMTVERSTQEAVQKIYPKAATAVGN